jgi:type I restriction enzyme M protein
LTYAADSPLRDAGLQDSQEDDLQDEYLGALAALGGSAGNVRLRDLLEWDVATYDAVKAQLLSRGLIVPGRGRGGSVALAGGEGTTASVAANAERPARRPRTAWGSSSSTASSFETAFRAAPKDGHGQLAKDAQIGDDLLKFVKNDLFPLPVGVHGSSERTKHDRVHR